MQMMFFKKCQSLFILEPKVVESPIKGFEVDLWSLLGFFWVKLLKHKDI